MDDRKELPEVCCKKGCDKKSKYQPVLLLRSILSAAPYEFRLGLALCPQHSIELDAEQFITDEGWPQLAELYEIATRSRLRPERSLTRVKYLPLPKRRSA